MPLPLELEGTWEEVAAHADELAGRRVRVTVLPSVGAGREDLRVSGSSRLPAMVESVECVAPFDLPHGSGGTRVKAHSSSVRLPDPPVLRPDGK